MPTTVPTLPAQGSTSWYAHYTALDTVARESQTYAGAAKGTRFEVWYEDLNGWPASRPSTRTDIYFAFCGGPSTNNGPAYMIDRDSRDFVQ